MHALHDARAHRRRDDRPRGQHLRLRGRLTVVVGAVSQLYQGDLDFGRIALERLAGAELGADVALEPFDYGAVAVVQRLQELRPRALVLLGAHTRGRRPGSVERRVAGPPPPPAVLRQAVAEAVTGYVTIDLLLEVASGLGELPPDTVTIELEPVRVGPSPDLSDEAAAAVDEALELVRAELRRLQASSSTPSP